MRGFAILAALLTCGSFTESQKIPKHTLPTIYQCHADADAWNKEEDYGPKDKDVGYQLSYVEIIRREGEMLDCMTEVDAQKNIRGDLVMVRESYHKLIHIYTTAESARYQDFINRHNLFEQFVAEDAQGLR